MGNENSRAATFELDELREVFAEGSFEPVDESADDLARVRMGADYTVRVEILEQSIAPELKRNLETALQTAVNAAFRKAGELHAERLAAWSHQQRNSSLAD